MPTTVDRHLDGWSRRALLFKSYRDVFYLSNMSLSTFSEYPFINPPPVCGEGILDYSGLGPCSRRVPAGKTLATLLQI